MKGEKVMDLWIRSQNRMGNFKSNSQVIRRIGHEDGKEEFVILNDDKINELLGTYKTKERAIEVLDEIHYMIKVNIIMTSGIYYHLPKEEQMKIFPLDNNQMCIEISNQMLIYEMPKE